MEDLIRSNRRYLSLSILCLTLLGAARAPLPVAEASPDAVAPDLGSALSFAVLGASTVTNTGPTAVTGDLGLWPGTSVTGFPPGTVSGGVMHVNDAIAHQAQDDAVLAYDDLAGQPCDTDLTGQDLGGMTLAPGTYCFDDVASLTGDLELDAQGDSNAVFVFQIGSTLTTASNAAVNVIGGGLACKVFWQVGSSATLDIGTVFAGNLLALASITLNAGASLVGRAIALNAAVTMDTNDVSNAACFGPTAIAIHAFRASVADGQPAWPIMGILLMVAVILIGIQGMGLLSLHR